MYPRFICINRKSYNEPQRQKMNEYNPNLMAAAVYKFAPNRKNNNKSEKKNTMIRYICK